MAILRSLEIIKVPVGTIIAAFIFGIVITGCKANAENKPEPAKAKTAPKLTLDICTNKQDQKEMIACFEALNKQDDEYLKKLDADISRQRMKNAKLKREADAAMKELEERILEPEID